MNSGQPTPSNLHDDDGRSIRWGQPYETRAVPMAEIQALMKACSRRGYTGVRMKAWLALTAETGIRVGDSVRLKPSAFLWTAGQVTWRQSKLHRYDGEGKLKPCKRDAVRADIGGSIEVLKAWRDLRAKLAEERGWDPDRVPFFCKADGSVRVKDDGRTSLSTAAISMHLKRLAAKAGITEKVRPHGIRKGFASELANCGNVGIGEISRAMGHSNVATTAGYISEMNQDERRAKVSNARRDVFKDEAPADAEPTITMTKADIEQLVAEGVRRALAARSSRGAS